MTNKTTTPFPAAPAVRERPILFSAPMVRAVLAGTKMQTRRVLKRQPELPRAIYGSPGADTTVTPNLHRCENGTGVAWRFEMSKIASGNGRHIEVRVIDHEHVRIVCPYGNPGDRLWVRENHYLTDNGDEEYAVYAADSDGAREHLQRVDGLAADFPADLRARHRRQRPSIHMPRWASRILLEVTDVRVERLQDISDADALAEGVRHSYGEPFDATHTISDRRRYELLWEQINGPGSWATNPWVWAVSFRRVPLTGGISDSPPGGSTA